MPWSRYQTQAQHGMAPRARAKRCQVCWVHSSSFRRRCVRCHHMVAPGCYPEHCLAVDFGECDDELFGVCRPCVPMHVMTTRLGLTCRALPEALGVFRRTFSGVQWLATIRPSFPAGRLDIYYSKYTFCNPVCSIYVDVDNFSCLRQPFSVDSDGAWGPANGPGCQKCVDVAFSGSGPGGLYTGPKIRLEKSDFYIMNS